MICRAISVAIGAETGTDMVAGWEHAIAGVMSHLHGAIAFYRHLDPRIRATLLPLKMSLIYLPPIFILERLTGGKTTQYKSAGFRHDLFYWVWQSSGLYGFLFSGSFLAILGPYLKVFDLQLLASFNHVVRSCMYYVIAEFVGYWYHRWQHSNRFLWAFHTTHHSQEYLSFVSFNRFHPVDEFLTDIIPYIPLLMLGVKPHEWVPLFWLHRIIVYLQHSEVRLRLGPLEKIFVTPRFHVLHHSTDPAHYNRNFGPTLSLWDYCFGTACDAPWPARYGLPDVPMPTLASTFLVPFRLVYETYFKRRQQVEPAGAD